MKIVHTFRDGGHEVIVRRYELNNHPYWEILLDGILEYAGSQFVDEAKRVRAYALNNPLVAKEAR